MPQQSLSEAFIKKKTAIVEALSRSSGAYTDKSPKGSVDAPIIELINEINAIDGLITTSSCSGRVAVFVEGPQLTAYDTVTTSAEAEGNLGSNPDDARDAEDTGGNGDRIIARSENIKTGPGGKGGGKWLLVSHDSIPIEHIQSADEEKSKGYFTNLCGLTPMDDNPGSTTRSKRNGLDQPSAEQNNPLTSSPRRLIHLSFAPLILHILTADLSLHARPLLSAAINAGFRESGVQSLSILDPSYSDTKQATSSNVGTMLAIRTAGLNFETVIGQVLTVHAEDGTVTETMHPLVGEDYLRMCFEVINSRFEWNEKRKERLRTEIRKAFERVNQSLKMSETKQERWKRKREEGLRIKAEKQLALEQDRTNNVKDEEPERNQSSSIEIEDIELSSHTLGPDNNPI